MTLVTPTYARDYERFVFQRESMEYCGIDLPHLAIVHTEDLPLFRKMPFQKNLTLIPTCDLLGSSLDRRRQVHGISRRDYRYWITGRGVHGWMAQQLTKLAAAFHIKTRGMLCLDSDTFFVGRITDADFYTSDDRLHLYETTDDLDVEMAEWYAHSLRFLEIKEAGVSLRRFTHSPMALETEVVRNMCGHIEKLRGNNWMEAMIRGDRITEYTTYGAYARHMDEYKRVAPVKPLLTLYFWWKHQGAQLAEEFDTRLESSAAKIVLIHSNMGISVDQYRELASRRWPNPRGQVTV